MTTFKVPTADELRAQLVGLGRLLTARKWERAAIVFAFTEVGEVGVGRWRKPEPPKMYIREFAAQGFSGLTTNKAVSRYRDAWVGAVSKGWTTLAEPGRSVQIPEHPFPAWPYGTDEEDDADELGTVTVTEADENVSHMHSYRDYDEVPSPGYGGGTGHLRRSPSDRVLSHLDTAAKALSRLAEISNDGLDEDTRRELVEKLNELQKQTREALKALRGGLAAVR